MFKNSIIICSGIILLTACGTNSANNVSPTNSADTTGNPANAPVETKAPNTKYKPSIPRQTRIAGETTASAYTGTVVTDALCRPWRITLLPDGSFLITEKGGTMRRVKT